MILRRKPDNRLEIEICDWPDWNAFELLAQRIANRYDGQIVRRLDGLDQRYWDIQVLGQTVTLHLELYLGISLFAEDPRSNEVIRKIGEILTDWPMEEAKPC